MTPQQSELLASIQALAIAAHEQTGAHAWHSVRAGHGGALFSDVRVIEPRTLEDLHATTVAVGPDGWDMPTGTDSKERTLAQQRDELAQWIASNRKQEEAA